jgi:glutathione synthase/RimK-type ligase-like ATP-grasp enzyme
MRNEIVIITTTGDFHSYAVAQNLRRRGASVTVWHSNDYPKGATETIAFRNKECKMTVRDIEQQLPVNPTAVWHRRPAMTLDLDTLDPADVSFADLSCRMARRSLFSLYGRDAFWVNDFTAGARSNIKPLQQRVAVEAGFITPDTLYTNDPKEVRAFLRANGGSIIFKPISAHGWSDDEKIYTPYSAVLTEESLVADELLQSAPGIFQEYVPKQFELRITIMGRQAFAAKIPKPSDDRASVDWRLAGEQLVMEGIELPEAVVEKCLDVLRELGLVFGCFDFIVRPDDEFVFLEVNQMGQFLFVEDFSGLPLLAAFTDFLLARNRDFVWDRDPSAVTLEEIRRDAAAEMAAAEVTHLTAPSRYVPDRITL